MDTIDAAPRSSAEDFGMGPALRTSGPNELVPEEALRALFDENVADDGICDIDMSQQQVDHSFLASLIQVGSYQGIYKHKRCKNV